MKREEIIKISKETHEIEYDYSLVKDTKRLDDTIDVICKKHGVFHPRLSRFLKGSNCKYCVGKCLKNNDEFKKEYKEKYGIYDLTNFDYKGSHIPSIAICEKHGEFKISPTNLLSGCGCPDCKSDKLKELFSLTKEEFVHKSREIHGDKYEYIGEYVNNATPFEMYCNVCGKTFSQMPHNHLSGKGCPFCRKSHLENSLMVLFDQYDIKYEYQKKFNWLGKQSLDFYLIDYNIAIECQGIQHFEQTKFGDIDKNIEKDLQKFNLCIENNLKIIYLIYDKVDNLPSFYTEDNVFYSTNDIMFFFKK